MGWFNPQPFYFEYMHYRRYIFRDDNRQDTGERILVEDSDNSMRIMTAVINKGQCKYAFIPNYNLILN